MKEPIREGSKIIIEDINVNVNLEELLKKSRKISENVELFLDETRIKILKRINEWGNQGPSHKDLVDTIGIVKGAITNQKQKLEEGTLIEGKKSKEELTRVRKGVDQVMQVETTRYVITANGEKLLSWIEEPENKEIITQITKGPRDFSSPYLYAYLYIVLQTKGTKTKLIGENIVNLFNASGSTIRNITIKLTSKGMITTNEKAIPREGGGGSIVKEIIVNEHGEKLLQVLNNFNTLLGTLKGEEEADDEANRLKKHVMRLLKNEGKSTSELIRNVQAQRGGITKTTITDAIEKLTEENHIRDMEGTWERVDKLEKRGAQWLASGKCPTCSRALIYCSPPGKARCTQCHAWHALPRGVRVEGIRSLGEKALGFTGVKCPSCHQDVRQRTIDRIQTCSSCDKRIMLVPTIRKASVARPVAVEERPRRGVEQPAKRSSKPKGKPTGGAVKSLLEVLGVKPRPPAREPEPISVDGNKILAILGTWGPKTADQLVAELAHIQRNEPSDDPTIKRTHGTISKEAIRIELSKLSAANRVDRKLRGKWEINLEPIIEQLTPYQKTLLKLIKDGTDADKLIDRWKEETEKQADEGEETINDSNVLANVVSRLLKALIENHALTENEQEKYGVLVKKKGQ